MKILVAYYSKTGNTRRVAKEVAKRLGADIDEIKDLKNRDGIGGWIGSGVDALKENLTKIEVKKDPGEYDLVIVGTPVWAGKTTPATRTYVVENKSKIRKLGVLITSSNSQAEETVAVFEKLWRGKINNYQGWTREELKSEKIYERKMTELVSGLSK